MSNFPKRISQLGRLTLAVTALALTVVGISQAQAAPKPDPRVTALLERHFQHEDALYTAKNTRIETRMPVDAMTLHFNHEDAIYGRKGTRSLPILGAGSIGNSAGPSRGVAIRAAALNRRYGNGWTRVSPAEFRTLVSTFGAEVTATMTPQQARAELARGQGLNRLAEQYATAAKPIPSGSGNRFDWSVAGIGVGAGFGALFLVAAGALVLRRRGRPVLHS